MCPAGISKNSMSQTLLRSRLWSCCPRTWRISGSRGFRHNTLGAGEGTRGRSRNGPRCFTPLGSGRAQRCPAEAGSACVCMRGGGQRGRALLGEQLSRSWQRNKLMTEIYLYIFSEKETGDSQGLSWFSLCSLPPPQIVSCR